MKNKKILLIITFVIALFSLFGCTEKEVYKIKDISANTSKCVLQGQVIDTSSLGIILADDTGYIYITDKEALNDVKINDYIAIKGETTFVDNSMRITKITETTSYIEMDITILSNVVINNECLEQLRSAKNIEVRQITLDGEAKWNDEKIIVSNNELSAEFIPEGNLSDFLLQSFIGKNVECQGYLIGFDYDDKNIVKFILKDVKEKTEIENITQNINVNNDNEAYTVKGKIVALFDNTICLYDGTYLICKMKSMDNITIGNVVTVKGTSLKVNDYYMLKDASVEYAGGIAISENEPVEYEYSNISNPIYIKLQGIINNGIISKENNSYELLSNSIDFTLYNDFEYIIEGYAYKSNDTVNIMVISFNPINTDGVEIDDVLNGTVGNKYSVQGMVIGKNKTGFIIDDTTNRIFVYQSTAWGNDLEIGDIVSVTGVSAVYGDSIQFTTDAIYQKVGHTLVDLKTPVQFTDEFLTEYHNKVKSTIEYGYIEGVLTQSGSYYNIEFDDKDYQGSISYPLNTMKLNNLIGEKVKVIGFITSNKGIYVNILLVEISKLDATSIDESFDLHILEMNDLHGYCLQDENGKSGLSNAAYLINSIRNQNTKDDVVLIGAGDMFQGTALSNITHGLAIVEAMNAMKFDCMIVGNHEFDWGLPEIVKYFDGNKDNGEADFPLLNANIYNVNNDSLLTIENGNIFESTVIEKEGIKVGVIGYIGNVYTSISYVMRKDYYFNNNIASSALKIGTALKDSGVDIIVVAVHGGYSSGIESYTVNQELANLKYKDDYLVDAVINGHTHSNQSGLISRNGVSLPLVQGGSNCYYVGEIVLTIDMNTRDCTKAKAVTYSTWEADRNYDSNVEEVLNENYEENKETLEEVYTVAAETVTSSYSLMDWIGNVLVKGTGTSVGVINNGGIRSNGDIINGNNVTIENLYMINPFDNYIMICNIKGKDIYQFVNGNSVFYGANIDMSSLASSNEYVKVAVIDYVYYWDNFPRGNSDVTTNLVLRDLLIQDAKAHKLNNIPFAPISNPKAYLENQITNGINPVINYYWEKKKGLSLVA